MPKLIDLADVEAGLKDFSDRETPNASKPGMQGLVARAQLAVLPPMTRWRVAEMNLGSDPNEIMNGITALIAATISGEVMGVTSDADQQFEVVNRILNAIAEEVGSILTGRAGVHLHRHEPKEAGHA